MTTDTREIVRAIAQKFGEAGHAEPGVEQSRSLAEAMRAVETALEEAVAQEREECAALMDALRVAAEASGDALPSWSSSQQPCAAMAEAYEEAAAAIRARGTP